MPARLAQSYLLRSLDLRHLLPVSPTAPGARATAKENRMDLALALKPLLLAFGMEQVTPDEDANIQNTFRHPVTLWSVTLDPGTENWVALWDGRDNMVCEARVTGPAQAVKLLQVYGLLTDVEVSDAPM